MGTLMMVIRIQIMVNGGTDTDNGDTDTGTDNGDTDGTDTETNNGTGGNM
jgi:hypothetical protein